MTALTIGAVMEVLGGEYYGAILGGIQRAARERNARILVFRGTPGEVAAAPFAREVRGWLAVHSTAGLPALARLGLPLVTVAYHDPEVGCPAVLADNAQGVRDAVNHLIAHGHRRIAFVGWLGYPAIAERYDGYRAALIENDLPCSSELVVGVEDNNWTSGRAGAHKLLEGGGLPCTAVVAGTDRNAIGLMEILQAAGHRVPVDVAVVGFDDLNLAQFAEPPLTTLRTRFEELGRGAANLLLDEIGGTAVARRAHRVPVALIRRRSCGCDMADNLALPSGAEPLALRSNSALAAQLVRMALSPVAAEPGRPPEKIWPGVQTLLGGIDAALSGGPEPAPAALTEAWQEAVRLIPDLEVLRAMNTLLTRAAEQRLATAPPDPDRGHRVAAFLAQSEFRLWHARLGYEREQMAHLEELTQSSPRVAMALLSSQAGQAQELDWLRLTPVRWGCLALYADATRTPKTILRVAGTYGRSGPRPGTELVAGAFPPVDWFPESGADVKADVLMLLEVASASRDWGVLALCGPFEQTYGTYTAQRPNNMAMWGALLAAALDREALEARLAELADEDRKRAEQALRRSEASLAEAQRLSHMGSWVWDLSSRAVSWSAEMFRLFGFDPQHEEPSREAMEQRIHPDDRQRVRGIRETAVRDKIGLEYDYRILLPDGTVKQVHGTCHPVPNAAGEVIELLGTVMDVTERRQAEQALGEAQAALAHVTRVTTLGEVTASIAHEVNQPLAAMANNANACLNLLASGGRGVDAVREILMDIANDAERANDIIKRVRALARRSAPERVEVRPVDLVNDVLALAAAESAGRRMAMHTDVPADLPVVVGDRVQLQQVLLNLIVNAMDAMAGVVEGERRLEIRARLETAEGDRGVTISVADRGIGLQPDAAHRLFDAFYTTKPQGMGLGLAISRSIIEAHGGRLWAEPTPGGGALFSFHLPVAGELPVHTGPPGGGPAGAAPDQGRVESPPPAP